MYWEGYGRQTWFISRHYLRILLVGLRKKTPWLWSASEPQKYQVMTAGLHAKK
jgi:hypothetical protein